MMNKNNKLEWRVAAYMAVWTVVAALAKLGIVQLLGESTESVVGHSLIGILCITFAVILSYTEKNSDTPFLWIKKSPTKHWAMPGLLGVFTNACSIAAIGIGFMAKTILQLIVLYVIVAALMMTQRRIVEVSKEQKVRKVTLGLAIPVIAAVFVSGGFFYNNALGNLVKSMEEVEAKENLSGAVEITKANWQDYFTVENKEELEFNADDKLIRVKYNSVITLKEEFQDKVVYTDEKKSEVILNGSLHTELVIYEITDAKNAKWEVVRKSNEMKPKGDSDYFTQNWLMEGKEDFAEEYEFDSYSKGSKLYMEIPEEFVVEAVAGTLYFEE